MVYISVDALETNLADVAGGSEDYMRSEVYRQGYDTASDVATCANAETIWTCIYDKAPAEGVSVLAYSKDANMIFVGKLMGGIWWNDTVKFCDRVFAWAELPDMPSDME